MNDKLSGKQADLAGDDLEMLKKLSTAYQSVRTELSKVIVGQNEVIEQVMIAISPDLMPSDIVGTEVIQEDKASGAREFKFLKGPVFSNIVLADEINRTPPKTQAALLEAMQEKQVTIGGERHTLPAPFFVLATQNPIEQEGTYTLPEAQQDRFMFKVFVKYPNYDEEYLIAATTTSDLDSDVAEVLSGDEIVKLQQLVRRVPVAPHVIHFALRLVRATRILEDECPDFVKEAISWGAGPRGVQNLLLGAKERDARLPVPKMFVQ